MSLIDRFFSGRKDELRGVPEFVFVDRVIDKETVITGIKILGGPAKGMIFTWNPQVSFSHKDDGNIDMKFEYAIQVPPSDSSILDDNQLLTNIVGDIITSVIKKDLDNNNADRNVDF